MKAYRLLRADEIEVRISTCNGYGVGLLLYKDARCDQNILDEAHGAFGWQNSYDLIDGQLFATVSIWDDQKGAWVSKQNVGVESFTEKEKGRASDAFKRACFNWGIGRELYSAPNMWVFGKDLKTHEKDVSGKWTCKDAFEVVSLEYDGDRICYVVVKNLKTKALLEFGEPREAKEEREAVSAQRIPEAKVMALRSQFEKLGIEEEIFCKVCHVDSVESITEGQFVMIIEQWEHIQEACGA